MHYDTIVAILHEQIGLVGYVHTKSYIYLQSKVTTGSYITKRSVLQYITDRITTTLHNITM